MSTLGFKKILVANRGVAAVRVLRACREAGTKTVAVYSEADRSSGHLAMADECHLLGPADADQSYRSVDRILKLARDTGCDAIHPGYGFLAEDASFARRCAEAGMVFIGPTPAHLELLGDKVACRNAVSRAGVPVLPGSREPVRTVQEAATVVEQIGLPVILKPVKGGGGLATHVVRDAGELATLVSSVGAHAERLFGDAGLVVERYLTGARHLEVQIAADRAGTTVHCFERECSVQRHFQKVIEEAPATRLGTSERERLCELALGAARAVRYEGLCTAEFLYDGRDFYFIEINPRLQVEHGVSEVVTGVDLVREQIRIAAGMPLTIAPARLAIGGHAIEARVYAEDPATRLPAPGSVDVFQIPGGSGIRVDTFLSPGGVITDKYDPMIALVIADGPTREVAVQRLADALRRFVVNGSVRTNIPLLLQILGDERFIAGTYDTQFLDGASFAYRSPGADARRRAALVAALARSQSREGTRDANGSSAASSWRGPGWRNLP